MKLDIHGGYNLEISGRPGGTVERPAVPATLQIPLFSRRIIFSEISVENGAEVQRGDILARDPAHQGAVLLAPTAGQVELGKESHVTLHTAKDAPPEDEQRRTADDHAREHSDPGQMLDMLCRAGVWPLLSDIYTGELPDPEQRPCAVFISTVHLEPFLARGSVLLQDSLKSFARGLEYLQRLLEYEPIYLLLPSVDSKQAAELHELVRGYAWLRSILIEMLYPADNPMVAALELGVGTKPGECAWSLDVAGVLAVDAALTHEQPATERTISVGGPAATTPRHVRVPIGYPVNELVGYAVDDPQVRIINGGVLTGIEINQQHGVDVECCGLNVLENESEREFVGFLRPGADRRSYSRSFLGSLVRAKRKNLTTALRGDRRACIACGYCTAICPARIMPYLIHKRNYADDLDGVERARVDRCARCGLCSYVCPSKIELTAEMVELQHKIREEQAAVETPS